MTQTHSAARADQQQTWTSVGRIREVLPTSSDHSGRPSRVTYAEVMQRAARSIKAGWEWLERKRTLQLSSRRLRLAETISLGEKRSVSIVQVDGAQFLIGCSTGSVQLLAVLDKQNDVANRVTHCERAS